MAYLDVASGGGLERERASALTVALLRVDQLCKVITAGAMS
jgi:hypothetical protein